MGQLFGTDGIRGEANRYPMDAETAFAVGQAVTFLFRTPGHRARIIIGKDTRLSGDMLACAIAAGVTSMGGDALLADVLPTPGVAFLTLSMRADAGIMISASHNPFADNGIKLFAGSGFKLSDQEEAAIETHLLAKDLPASVAAPTDMGRALRLEDAVGRYSVFLKSAFPRHLSLEGLKIVVDTANGAAWRVAPETLRELGAQVEVLHAAPDGRNINAGCGSQHPEDLQAAVRASGAHLGLAFDGDADRLIAVDEAGGLLTGDHILLICARHLKREGRLPANRVVTTVMSNLGFFIAARREGLECHTSAVGDRYVLEDMRRLGALLGGEQSGHMIFLQHHTTGDGLLTALQLSAAMLASNRPLSELARIMDIYPQMLLNVEVARKPALETVPAIVQAIREVEAELGDEGRVVVRYSGTQNLCRVMVEGPSARSTDRACHRIAEVIHVSLT